MAALALLITVLPAGVAQAASERSGRHDQIVEFWTHARVKQAVPRDFVVDPASGRFQMKKPDNPGGGNGGGKGKPGGNGGTTVLGSSWNGGGDVADTTGKVLFAMGGSYYVCSASLVDESAGDRSIVLTAAHCAYDETAQQFATNWVFIPNYDAAPAPLDTNQSFCADTLHGCWTADALVVHTGYATAGGFNAQAVEHDFAFAALGQGGHSGSALAETLGTQNITFAAGTADADTHLFGYPAAKKYKGDDLVYCRGPLGYDSLNSNNTYRVGCKMTGGSSGGPWFASFNSGSGTGTLMSVNSYGYSGIDAMHGPIFNSKTADVYDSAQTASGNVTVP